MLVSLYHRSVHVYVLNSYSSNKDLNPLIVFLMRTTCYVHIIFHNLNFMQNVMLKIWIKSKLTTTKTQLYKIIQ